MRVLPELFLPPNTSKRISCNDQSMFLNFRKTKSLNSINFHVSLLFKIRWKIFFPMEMFIWWLWELLNLKLIQEYLRYLFIEESPFLWRSWGRSGHRCSILPIELLLLEGYLVFIESPLCFYDLCELELPHVKVLNLFSNLGTFQGFEVRVDFFWDQQLKDKGFWLSDSQRKIVPLWVITHFFLSHREVTRFGNSSNRAFIMPTPSDSSPF